MTAQPLDAEFVRRVALLARLGLAEDEAAGLGHELAGLLAHFEALQDVDTEGVDPLVHALDTPGAAADDVVDCPPDPRGTLLPLAPQAREGFYLVPRVLDADFGPPDAADREAPPADPDPAEDDDA